MTLKGKKQIPGSGILAPSKYTLRAHFISMNPFRKDLGKIRLNVQLFEEQILPWECYIPLVNMLVETVKSRPYGDVTSLSLLEQVMTADRTAIGRALVKLYLSQGMIANLLDALTQAEVNTTGK